MQQISIITNAKKVHDKILSRLNSEIGNEIAVETGSNAVKLYSENDYVKLKIIDSIADIIIEEYENKFIAKIINQNYCYFNPLEKKDIYYKAINYLIDKDNYLSNYLYKKKYQIIIKNLSEYLQTTDDITLEGFINFRLKEYQEELGEIIEKAVDDFLIEKEYNEFIKLLKYFVSIQKSKYNEINVVIEEGSYKIFDDNKKEITTQCSNEFIDVDNDEIKSDDILISSLISISPKIIILHKKENIKNLELLNTIKNVFGSGVKFCEGCLLCNS